MALLLDTLRSVDFLAEAGEDAIVRFMVLGRSAHYPKGHCFWRSGMPPQGVVIPVSGRAKTVVQSPEGREFIDRFVGPGESMGLEAAVDGLPHPTNAEAVHAGEFFTIAPAALRQFLEERPQIVSAILSSIGRRYRENLQEREDIALRPVNQRVALFLLNHACLRQSSGARVLVHATQAEIASRLGTVREVVARIFADFSQRSLIERTDSSIFITDWKGIQSEAGLDASQTRTGDTMPQGVASRARTVRFFLPQVERKRHCEGDETEACREFLGSELGGCVDRGCPVSAQPGAPAAKHPPGRATPHHRK